MAGQAESPQLNKSGWFRKRRSEKGRLVQGDTILNYEICWLLFDPGPLKGMMGGSTPKEKDTATPNPEHG